MGGGRALGLGGLLAEPEGDEPRWTLRRRAVANALRAVAPEARVLVVATPEDGPGELMGLQALDVASEANPALMRTVRRASPEAPARLRHLDPPLAEAEAASREIDSLWAAALARAEPGMGRADPPALALAPARSTPRLKERGLVWGDPPAPHHGRGRAAPHLLAAAPRSATRTSRPRSASGSTPSPTGPSGGPTPWPGPDPARPPGRRARAGGPGPGRVLGDCPECAGPMRPRPGWLACACGVGYPLPRRGEVTAVPGATCPACRAPMLRVDRGPLRCADRRECDA